MRREAFTCGSQRAVPTPVRSFPQDAHAVIYKPARSAMTSGKRRMNEWKLRFEARSAPYIEPLMGWTASDDALQQVELSFPTAEAAVTYAQRRGLSYTVQDWTPPAPKLSVVAASTDAARSGAKARKQRLEWVERTLGCGILYPEMRSETHPSAAFSNPGDVLKAAALSPDQKRDALLRWAYDSYLVERSHAKGERAEISPLGEIIDALLDLEQTEPGSPIGHPLHHARAA
jgi:hypothetical protein